MEPSQHSQARRWTGSTDQVSFDEDDAGGPRAGTAAGGSTDDEPESLQCRTPEGNDWVEARRRERRRERERRWEQLQLVA